MPKPVIVYRPLDLAVEAQIERILRQAEEFARSHGLRPVAGGVASAWSFTNTGRTSLLDGTFDLDTDTFLIALFLSTSNIGAASTTYALVTNEHANANGYITGGISLGPLTLSGTTTVTVDDPADAVWTASGGSITARFAVIYESVGRVLCFTTLDTTPADVSASDGNTLSIVFHVNGLFTLA